MDQTKQRINGAAVSHHGGNSTVRKNRHASGGTSNISVPGPVLMHERVVYLPLLPSSLMPRQLQFGQQRTLKYWSQSATLSPTGPGLDTKLSK